MGAGVLLVMVMQMSTGSLRVALLVMANLPLALVKGIAAIYVTESQDLVANSFALFGIGGCYVPPVISIASMVGFVTLFGIAVRNGILLVNHCSYIIQNEGKPLVRASPNKFA
jgi:HME family heavy-metal exporter